MSIWSKGSQWSQQREERLAYSNDQNQDDHQLGVLPPHGSLHGKATGLGYWREKDQSIRWCKRTMFNSQESYQGQSVPWVLCFASWRRMTADSSYLSCPQGAQCAHLAPTPVLFGQHWSEEWCIWCADPTFRVMLGHSNVPIFCTMTSLTCSISPWTCLILSAFGFVEKYSYGIQNQSIM